MNSPNFFGFFLTPDGQPSMRRLLGFMTGESFLAGKTALFVIGLKKELPNFAELNASLNEVGKLSLAFFGFAAIDSVANLFKKKDKE